MRRTVSGSPLSRACMLVLLVHTGGVCASEPAPARVVGRMERWFAELPDFVCVQAVERFEAGHDHGWQRAGESVTELTVIKGVERYLLLEENGREVASPRVVDFNDLGSRGEFASALRALFAPPTQAAFSRRGQRRIDGARQRRYDFSVRRAKSQWFVGPAPGVAIGYDGSVWVDETTGDVRSLEMEAVRLPEPFPFRAVHLRLSLAPTAIAGRLYVLPERGEVTVCTDHWFCERKKIAFRQYRKFSATSQLLP